MGQLRLVFQCDSEERLVSRLSQPSLCSVPHLTPALQGYELYPFRWR